MKLYESLERESYDKGQSNFSALEDKTHEFGMGGLPGLGYGNKVTALPGSASEHNTGERDS